MTVAELIEKLKQFPLDAEVIQFDDDAYHSGEPDPALIEHEGRTVVAL